MFHFFESYRELHLQHIRELGYGLSKKPYTLNPIEAKIMNTYDDLTLLRVHQVFPLVVSSFYRRLRPPSFAGRLERTLRGYLKDPPSDNVYVAALCVGGLRQVERFCEVKGYTARRAAVDAWHGNIMRELAEPMPKLRQGLRGLHREKSNIAMNETGKYAAAGTVSSTRNRHGSDDDCGGSEPSACGYWTENLAVDTSLAAGMPMAPLTREDLKLLVPDLPLLWQVWLPTAEAMILQRKIVERPQDIKRNAQVLLELIREDGAAEEDEWWWYGRSAPESVRPPLEAIEERFILGN